MAGRSHIVLCGADGLAIRVLDELVALGEDVVLVVRMFNIARAPGCGDSTR